MTSFLVNLHRSGKSVCLSVMLTNSLFNNLSYSFKEDLDQGELLAPSEISLSFFLEPGLLLNSCLLASPAAPGSYYQVLRSVS